MAFNHGFAVIIDIGSAPPILDGAVAFAVHPANTASLAQDVQSISVIHDHGSLPDHQPNHRHPKLHTCLIHIWPLCPVPSRHIASSIDDNGASDL